MTALSARLVPPFRWVSGTHQSSYYIASWLFIRCIALIYLIAFLSLSVQITGLVGHNGILPFDQLLHYAEQVMGKEARFKIPTLLWYNASDTALLTLCYAGAFFSVLLFLGRFAFFSSISLYVLYLSLFHAGQIFLEFQWDILLLEAGFLTILLVRGYDGIVIFLFHWLLFRLRFLSGLSKLEDPSWANLTALKYYFETQVLPHIGGWYFHQLPEWLLRFGTGFTLFMELIVPFFIFLPRRFRLTAALLTIFFQLLIMSTSNHNWINLLTISLCLFLLDDQFLTKRVPGAIVSHVKKLRAVVEQSGKSVCRMCYFVIAIIIVSTSFASAYNFFTRGSIPEVFNWVRIYGLGNAYHIYPSMQTQRYEFDIQGSMDGKVWKSYRFKYKPNGLKDMPPVIIPHQPRLDWMIWFVPSKAQRMQPWFFNFLDSLYRNSPEVTGLLAYNPFKNAPPRYIRVRTYLVRFTNEEEYRKTGEYWKAKYIGLYPDVPPRFP